MSCEVYIAEISRYQHFLAFVIGAIGGYLIGKFITWLRRKYL